MFEVVVTGIPISHQTRNKDALRAWKARVSAAAAALRTEPPETGPVRVTIVYYYDTEPGDIDNIAKPIQDALNGVVYVDDRQVRDRQAHKRDLNGHFRVRGISPVLATGFIAGTDFVHIRVEEALDPVEPV